MSDNEQEVIDNTGDAGDAAASNERDNLIQAAEKAMAAEGGQESSAKGERAAEKPQAKPKTEAATTEATKDAAAQAEVAAGEEENAPRIAAILRAREKARETVDKSKQEAESLIAKAREDAEKIRKDTIESAKKEAEEHLRAVREKFNKAPLGALNELGIDREQLVNEVAREGSPEWQAMKRQESVIEAMRKELEDLKGYRSQLDKDRQEAQQRYAQDQRIAAEQRFLSMTTLEHAPNLRKLYSDDEILQKGHAIADRIQRETGERVSLEEIRDYLESEAKKRVDVLRQPAAGEKSPAPKTRANGSRTLSGTSQSERRAAPKTARDAKTPEEEYQILKDAAEAAIEGFQAKTA